MSDTLIYLPDDFDPRTQLLNYTSAFGETLITFEDLQEYLVSNIQVSIIFGCRIGCAGLMILALWLISKNKRTPIFILNQLSLLFLIIHSALYVNYLFGPYNSMVENFTGFDFSTPNSRRVSIAASVCQVLLIMCIEGSLVFQVKIIFRSPEVQKLGVVMTLISLLFGLATIGCYLAACIKTTTSLNSSLSSIYLNLPIIMFAVSTVFICITLIAKLGLAIRSRRYLGLRQFGTLQILIIMTTQTMIIPTVLIILSFGYITTIYTRLTPIAILIVTLQLPLSSMWATSANNSPEPSSTGGSLISKLSSPSDYYPSVLSTNNDNTLYAGNGNSLYSLRLDSPRTDNLQFALYPTKKHSNESKDKVRTGLDMYEINEDDKSLWEELHRLTVAYNENDSDEFVSTVVHKINSM